MWLSPNRPAVTRGIAVQREGRRAVVLNAAGQIAAIAIREIATPASIARATAIMASDLQSLRAITVLHITTCIAAHTIAAIRMPITDRRNIIAPTDTRPRALVKVHHAGRVHLIDIRKEIADHRRAAVMPRRSHEAVPAAVPAPERAAECRRLLHGVVVDLAAEVLAAAPLAPVLADADLVLQGSAHQDSGEALAREGLAVVLAARPQ